MKTKSVLIATACVTLIATPTLAHDTWLMPRTALAVDGKALLVDLSTGSAFPKMETGPKAGRVAAGGWRCGAGNGPVDDVEEETAALALSVSPTGTGTAVVFVTLQPNSIELEPSEVGDYFDEIGAPEALRHSWEQEGPDAKFRETYTKHAKTFVRMSEEGKDEDKACLRPVGQMIELIPQRDPTTLAVGDSLVVKATGKSHDELESFAVTIVCGETGESQMLRTNKAGFVVFEITDGGWWLVKGTQLRHKADGTFDSDFTTMTFFVDD